MNANGRHREPPGSNPVRQNQRTMLKKSVDKTIRRYTNFDEMKADEYRYWQSRPVHERVRAVFELTQEQYALKGAAPDVPRLQRTLVRLERASR